MDRFETDFRFFCFSHREDGAGEEDVDEDQLRSAQESRDAAAGVGVSVGRHQPQGGGQAGIFQRKGFFSSLLSFVFSVGHFLASVLTFIRQYLTNLADGRM